MSAVADRVSVKRKKSKQAGNAAQFLATDSDGAPDSGQYAAWGQYLTSRKTPRPLRKLLKSDLPPLSWGLEGLQTTEATQALIAAAWSLSGRNKSRSEGSRQGPSAKRLKQAASDWLAADSADLDLDTALACLAWAYALPTVTDIVDATTWRRIYDRTVYRYDHF